MFDAAQAHVDVPSGTALLPMGRVRIEYDAPAATLRRVFQEPLMRMLARRSGCYEVRLREGRQVGEALAVITATGRRNPLWLFFPEAKSLTAEDVERIVRNVLEGMGPLFP